MFKPLAFDENFGSQYGAKEISSVVWDSGTFVPNVQSITF